MQPQQRMRHAASFGAPQANGNDFYFFPPRRTARGELDQSELRLHSTNGCGAAERCDSSGCGTLNCVTECCDYIQPMAVVLRSGVIAPAAVPCIVLRNAENQQIV